MAMQILDLEIGSEKWKAVRTRYKVASEAPAMMGADPNLKRSDLLRLKATGVEREIDEWVERFVFKRGHETEAAARPFAEARLGDELYALVGVNEVDGLALLASYDGITAPMYDIHWEHKQYNKELFAIVEAKGDLPPRIYWQLEHQLLVNENDSCIFAVSDGTEKNYVEMEYHSVPERRAQLIEGWKLFDEDLNNYTHKHQAPPAQAATIKDLPALNVEIYGEVKSSNLALYRSNALDFISQIKTNLKTDEDFLNAKNMVKFLADKEKELDLTERKILSQSTDIEEVTRTLAQLKEEMRKTRLKLDKTIKSEEGNRKGEIIEAAKKQWDELRAVINEDLSPYALPDLAADFAGAGKLRRTMATYEEAINNELLRLRREAAVWTKTIKENIKRLEAVAGDHMAMFPDKAQLVLRDVESMEAIASKRISDHQEEQAQAQARAAKAAPAASTAAPEPAQSAAPARPTATVSTYPVNDRRGLTIGSAPDARNERLQPPDTDLIKAVAIAFNVDTDTALEWIAAIDIDAARKDLRIQQAS